MKVDIIQVLTGLSLILNVILLRLLYTLIHPDKEQKP